MKLKTNKERYMLQIGTFVYDYKFVDSVEKIIVACSDDLYYHSVYNFINGNLILAFTNMTDDVISSYRNDLLKNYQFIVETGREDRKDEGV